MIIGTLGRLIGRNSSVSSAVIMILELGHVGPPLCMPEFYIYWKTEPASNSSHLVDVLTVLWA